LLTRAHDARQAAGYTVVGVDKTPSPALRGTNCHEFVCDIRDLMPAEEKGDAEDAEGTAVCEGARAPKRGTSAPLALKALLASLGSSSAGTKVDLLVNNAACQARRASTRARTRAHSHTRAAVAPCAASRACTASACHAPRRRALACSTPMRAPRAAPRATRFRSSVHPSHSRHRSRPPHSGPVARACTDRGANGRDLTG
jgi:hypothetical protein